MSLIRILQHKHVAAKTLRPGNRVRSNLVVRGPLAVRPTKAENFIVAIQDVWRIGARLRDTGGHCSAVSHVFCSTALEAHVRQTFM